MSGAESFNHLVREREQGRGYLEAERFGGLHVDNHFEPSGLLHRQVGRLFALENAAGIDADLTKRLFEPAAITHQAAGNGKGTIRGDRRHFVTHCQVGELLAPADEERIGTDN